MIITLNKLVMENFKNHKSLEINFDSTTNIFGRNGAGKSGIGEAITWVLFGTDMLGSKFEPKPVNIPDAETKVELTLTADGKAVTLGRSQVKTAKYYINDVPAKATEYSEFVNSFFDKGLFLSLFNPVYFFSQKWQEQRTQVLQYIDEPLNAEVFAELPDIKRSVLEGHLKKHTLDDLEKIHKERYKKRDSESERANERVLTLEEQLEKLAEPAESDEAQTLEELKEELNSLLKQRFLLDEELTEQRHLENKRTHLQTKLQMLAEEAKRQKQLMEVISKQPIEENCETCGQALTEQALDAVKHNRNKQIKQAAEIGKQRVAEFQLVKQELENLPQPKDKVDSMELDERIYHLRQITGNAERIERLKQEIKESKANAETIRKERNDSLEIVTAVKEFRSKQAELMVKKVGQLFTTISVRLYEELKNGDLRDTFEIEMDGKPYSKLSTAEKIKCGLEMIEVISQQSGVVAPTFVDNAESILRYTAPSGQLITAKVKSGDLKIETKSSNQEVA